MEVKLFDSVGELVDWTRDFDATRRGSRSNWIGRAFSDPDDAASIKQQACEAWPDGLAMLDAARSRLSQHVMPTPKSRRRRAHWDEFAGDEICLDRLRSGSPFWRATERASVTGPSTITIAIDYAASGAVDADTMVWRGIAAIVLTEILEAAGYRVELVTYCAGRESYANGDSDFSAAVIKAADSPLDAVALVNATAGWFFRVFGIGAIDHSYRGVDPDGGYGYHDMPTQDQLGELLERRVDVKIDSVWDEYAATELVESTLARLERGELVAG